MKKLFIVCPFSCMEVYLQKRYGTDILFVTSAGAMLPYGDREYLAAIGELIQQENISDIYIVNDSACPFINGIFTGKQAPRFPAVARMEDLFITHYFSHFKHLRADMRPLQLAGLYVQQQMIRLESAPVLQAIISQKNINIHGLVTIKHRSIIKEITTGSTQPINDVKWLPELELN